MSVPTKRRTSSQKRRRASQGVKKTIHLSKCAKCGSDARPYFVCSNCGEYKKAKKVKNQKIN